MTYRPLAASDLDAIDGLNPPAWPRFRPTFEHYLTTDCAQPYGLFAGGELAAMGTLIDFGSSVWIAQLITRHDWKGRGYGSQVLGRLLAEARDRGRATVSLVATEEGFPLYDRAGFQVEAWYDFWERESPAPVLRGGSGRLRPLEDRDVAAVRALDREVSGEDRYAYWKTLTTGALVAEGPGGLEGMLLPRFGEGLLAARNPDAGRALLRARLDGSRRCVVPRGHPAAADLEARGFRLGSSARRMVLGPALPRNPDLLWSRVGGNLG